MMHHLDLRRLLCPLPVIRLQDAVAEVAVNDQIEMVCTDPGVKNDIPAWCRINGHHIAQIIEQDDDIVITVTKCHDE